MLPSSVSCYDLATELFQSAEQTVRPADFKNAHGINVPRSRFLPVKSCSDLLLITSDLYQLEHGQLKMNPERMFQSTPVVKLGDAFKKVRRRC